MDRPDREPLEPLLGLWLAEDGKTVLIELAGADAQYPLRVTVTPGLREPPFPGSGTEQAGERTERLPAKWIAPGRGPRRDDFERVEVEAGQPGLGRTYQLVVAVAGDDGRWRARRSDDPREALRLRPETGAGFVDAVCWTDDEGVVPWAEPLTAYRSARADELAIYVAARG